MKTYLLKIYHGFDKGKHLFTEFLDNIAKTLEEHEVVFGLNYHKGEYFYSLSADDHAIGAFESQFYSSFNDFQLTKDDKGVWNYDLSKTVVGEITLENKSFFPFEMHDDDGTEFAFNMFRSFENFDVINDKLGFFVEVEPMQVESTWFYISSMFRFFFFRIWLSLNFFKYMFNFKVQKNWKKEGYEYFHHKLNKELFKTKVYIVMQASNKQVAEGKVRAIFNNFMIFKNYPLNQFNIAINSNLTSHNLNQTGYHTKESLILSSEEISSFMHFPKNPKTETSLLKVTSRKLALPIGVATFDFDLQNNEVVAKGYPTNINIMGVSDYRSIKIPVGIYDEDRLRHIYTIGKTGVGKSKYLMSLIINDIKQGRGLGIIDPHGDLIEEAIMHIPPERKDDVIIFDPTDEKYPFCLNPLDIKEDESKQVLAKGFIDIFKKFFGANWNPKLEHVLRMVFLALLDKKGSTLFDVVRALTDKDFRYTMIEAINDDVVRNFWTNEFAGWSQQFNTEAIMPILNKIGQILSIEALKNIFASTENKLDFRKMMDSKKILLVKLPKGKLQEEIMGFLGAMFVTKIYQAAMGRQSVSKSERTPFFLYVDEFQNFATETFNEILSEARKYGLGLCVAHQFINQIPKNISEALFGNVGTLVSFRISSDDALYMKKHFEPFLDAYDLANLNQREYYCKLLVNGQVKDPFSLRTSYMPDPVVDRDFIKRLYEISREKYSRTLEEAKKVVAETQHDVIEKIEEFAEPFI